MQRWLTEQIQRFNGSKWRINLSVIKLLKLQVAIMGLYKTFNRLDLMTTSVNIWHLELYSFDKLLKLKKVSMQDGICKSFLFR